MKTILQAILISALVVSPDRAESQSYELVSDTRFALRIHTTGLTPQPSRVAGADHMVSAPPEAIVILDIGEAGGQILIDNDEFTLDEAQSKALRQGRSIVVNKEFRVTLSSNASDRTSAFLIIQSQESLDKELLNLVELRLIRPEEKKQNKAEMATPRKPSD